MENWLRTTSHTVGEKLAQAVLQYDSMIKIISLNFKWATFILLKA